MIFGLDTGSAFRANKPHLFVWDDLSCRFCKKFEKPFRSEARHLEVEQLRLKEVLGPFQVKNKTIFFLSEKQFYFVAGVRISLGRVRSRLRRRALSGEGAEAREE